MDDFLIRNVKIADGSGKDIFTGETGDGSLSPSYY